MTKLFFEIPREMSGAFVAKHYRRFLYGTAVPQQFKRLPLALDSGFYASTYPDAALAIAEGHYADPLHHYQAVGFAKGYRPLP